MPNSSSSLNIQGGALMPTNNGGQQTLGQQVLPAVPINFGSTLPSVPNPTPAPPKTLTVVTPQAAQTDLASKQDTTAAVSNAVTAQTQSNLAAAAQPTAQQQPQPQTAQQTLPPGTTASTQQPAGGVTGNTTTTPPNSTAVTLPNGVQAYYNNNTQQLTTASGQQLTYNNATSSWIDPTTGQPPAPAGTTGAPINVPTTGDPTTDYINQQLSLNQQAADQASATYQTQIQQLLTGTFPLTSDQQTQVAGLQNSYNQLISTQQQANQNYTNATTILGIRNGTQQYAPAYDQTKILGTVTQGVQEIANLDSQAATAVASLKSGFLNDDYTLINASYKDLTDALTAKTTTLQDMQDNVTKAIQDQTDKIQNQTAQLANQTAAITSIAASALQQSLGADGQIDLNKLTQIAQENGVDPQALYGAALKEQQTETTAQESEATFATQQLQAAATLANTKATTAKTYADINAESVASSDPAAVASWATNIKNGTAKLSDITGDPALKSAVSEALASGGSSADTILATTQQSLQELNDMVTNNQGFTGAVGSKLAFGTVGGLVPGGLPGSSEADFNAKLNQVKNDVILPNLTLLHGLGRVTDREFQALTSAVTSLNTNESEAQFKSDLASLTTQINAKIAEDPVLSGGTDSSSAATSDASPAKGTDGTAYGFPGYTSDGTQWVPNQ